MRALIEAPVLHELARHFHGVPFYKAEPRGAFFIDAREHTLERMTEFMEQSFNIDHRQAGNTVFLRNGEISADDGKRRYNFTTTNSSRAEIIHPGAAAFQRASYKRIEIEMRNYFFRSFFGRL